MSTTNVFPVRRLTRAAAGRIVREYLSIHWPKADFRTACHGDRLLLGLQGGPTVHEVARTVARLVPTTGEPVLLLGRRGRVSAVAFPFTEVLAWDGDDPLRGAAGANLLFLAGQALAASDPGHHREEIFLAAEAVAPQAWLAVFGPARAPMDRTVRGLVRRWSEQRRRARQVQAVKARLSTPGGAS